MEEDPNRTEAERLLGIAEKLLHSRDLNGSRDFAILAQETEPLLDGSDQILAIVDVLLSAEDRINNKYDWYAVLQMDRKSDDQDLIKRQYRKLALQLHPDKNRYPFADHAFKLVAEAWSVLSSASKKTMYDSELNLFYTKVDLNSSGKHNSHNQHVKLPVKRTAGVGLQKPSVPRLTTFWTACPYCYGLFEYPRVYEECCLRCNSCRRAFHAAMIPQLPPLVPGKDEYYCSWAFFPMGFALGESEKQRSGDGGGVKDATTNFPNWIPPVFPQEQETETTNWNFSQNGGGVPEPAAPQPPPPQEAVPVGVGLAGGFDVMGASASDGSEPGKKKRGRPRKTQF